MIATSLLTGSPLAAASIFSLTCMNTSFSNYSSSHEHTTVSAHIIFGGDLGLCYSQGNHLAQVKVVLLSSISELPRSIVITTFIIAEPQGYKSTLLRNGDYELRFFLENFIS